MGLEKLCKLGITIVVFHLTSCQLFFGNDDELTFKRESIKNSNIKLNGYYYYTYSNGKMAEAYFLYRNGTILSLGVFPTSDWNGYEDKFGNTEFAEKIRSMKFNWGLFQIENNKIKFERWYPSEKPYHTGIQEGSILNDSTFLIEKVISSTGKEISKNKIYHFKKFSPKIDSITGYIN